MRAWRTCGVTLFGSCAQRDQTQYGVMVVGPVVAPDVMDSAGFEQDECEHTQQPQERILQKEALAEWAVHQPMPMITYQNESGKACASISFPVRRRAKFYVIDVMGTMCALSTMGLTAYGLEVSHPPRAAPRRKPRARRLTSALGRRWRVPWWHCARRAALA